MIALARSLLVTWVVIWSTSRQDVALHLVAWIILGSAIAAFTRETWLEKFPFVVDFAEDTSSELLDILPDAKALVNLFSVAVCGMASFFLAGAEHKKNKAALSGKSMRGAWLFFACSRILFPVSACNVDVFNPSAQQDYAESGLFALFTVFSLVGPLSSWPSRSFAISDAVYAIIVQSTNQSVCSGTEAAVVAASLALAHDAVHTRFLIFLESAAFALATVFIIETTITVVFVREDARDESWNEALNLFGAQSFETYIFTKAPPALLSGWAVGMFLRTFTQGRITSLELVLSLMAGLSFGGIVLYTSRDPVRLMQKPSFTCATMVVAMGCTSRLAAGRKRALKKNQYIVASGFFRASAPPPVLLLQEHTSSSSSTDSASTAAISHHQLLFDETDSAKDVTSAIFKQHSDPKFDPYNKPTTTNNNSNAQQREDSALTMLSATSSDSNNTSNNAVRVENLVKEHNDQVSSNNKVEKRLFYLEALLKGHPSPQEKETTKAEIEQLKAKSASIKQRVLELGKILDQEHEKH